jgi:hypothetical protein
MIVIPSFNGFDYLEEQLRRMSKHAPDEKVIVVNTKSSDPKFDPWARELCARYGVEYVMCTDDEMGYEYGALLKALWVHPNEPDYVLIHDSLWIKSDQTISTFRSFLRPGQIVAWHFFMQEGSGWDNEEQREWLRKNFGTDQYRTGIYGQVFMVTNEDLRKMMHDMGDVWVDNKTITMGMERAWPIVARKNGIGITFLEHWKGPIFSESYKFFVKAPRKMDGPLSGARM